MFLFSVSVNLNLLHLSKSQKSYLTFRKHVRQNNPNVALRKQTEKNESKEFENTDLKEPIRSKSGQGNIVTRPNIDLLLVGLWICNPEGLYVSAKIT